MSEPILEPVWRLWRFFRARAEMHYCDTLLDFGSGLDNRFLKFAKSKYKTGYVFEPRLNKTDYPRDNSVDVITALAVIEHLEDPTLVLKRLYKVLKPGGKIIVTTPSPLNWAILEILSNLHLQSRREIDEHETYYFRKSLLKLFKNAGYKNIKHDYFEFWLNNLVVAQK